MATVIWLAAWSAARFWFSGSDSGARPRELLAVWLVLEPGPPQNGR